MQITESKYLALTTFKKSGQGVATPMWFGLDGDCIYMQTNAASWKVKRIANSPTVEVRPSDSKGKPLGDVQSGVAELHSPDSRVAEKTIRLLVQHYGWIYRIFNFGLWLFRRKLVYVEVRLLAKES